MAMQNSPKLNTKTTQAGGEAMSYYDSVYRDYELPSRARMSIVICVTEQTRTVNAGRPSVQLRWI